MTYQTSFHEETRARSLTKTIVYRIVVVLLDFTFVYLITRQLFLATGFAVASNIYSAIAYYFHERIWNGIAWGKIRS